MNTYPKVSVVMSVYNGASHLAATLDSILSQEGVELEFIVVNDGSRDKSGEILNEYAQRGFVFSGSTSSPARHP